MPTSSPRPAARRIPKWLKVVIFTVLGLANLALLAAIWLLYTGERALDAAQIDREVVAALDEPVAGELTFLVVGSDSREGLDDLTNFGSFSGSRADVVMLVRVGRNGSAQMLSIPRDLWVDIPGHGQNRINAAYAFGGPKLMVETVRQNLEVQVNHYVEIDFVGFIALVDQLGGIELAFPNAARDLKSGLDVAAGPQVLDGDMALAYARSRGYQELQNGSWVNVKANDIGRTERQQEVIRAILAKLKRPSSVTEASEISRSLARHVTIDSTLASSSVANLFWDFKGVLTGPIDGATLPTKGQTIKGASVQVRVEPDAGTMLANFRAGLPLAAQALWLQVLNGNGINGAAGEVSQLLEAQGFEVASIGDAESKDYAETLVLVPMGSSHGAQIVQALGFGVVEFRTVDKGYDAVVIVGADAA